MVKKTGAEREVFIKVFITIILLILLIHFAAHFINTEVGDYRKSMQMATQILTHTYISPSIEHGGLFFILSVVGSVFYIYLIYTIISIVYMGNFGQMLSEGRTMKSIAKLKDHFIICGGGRVGSNVAKELKKLNKHLVVIEYDIELAKQLRRLGILVLEGDSLEKENLNAAGINHAKCLISCLGSDGDNVLLTITAKDLNPKLNVIARVNYERFVDKLRSVGANVVVMPEIVGGIKIAQLAAKEI